MPTIESTCTRAGQRFWSPARAPAGSVSASREAAEEFVARDPFVADGVVRAYEIRGWDEILGSD
ncbi:MAG TPA: YciI family protein [Solirubrobacteraceae bacterium]|nr:YciI family protein [Solirubrobacteraceae bacterium]